MAYSHNYVCLAGARFTKDGELKFASNGNPCLSFSVAISEQFKTASGEKKENTSFLRCVMWGKYAELRAKDVTRGRKVTLHGKIKQRQYTDNSGATRDAVEIEVADFFPMDDNGRQNYDEQQPNSNGGQFNGYNGPGPGDGYDGNSGSRY